MGRRSGNSNRYKKNNIKRLKRLDEVKTRSRWKHQMEISEEEYKKRRRF